MKTNYPAIAAFAAFFTVFSVHSSPLVYNPDAARDFFASPSYLQATTALTPLKVFFDQAEEKVSRQDPNFFSHAFSPFIQKTYNSAQYAENLSRDGRNVTDFLILSNQYNFTTEQTYTGLRLFHNKFKEVALIDDTVMDVILATLPVELDRHFPFNPLLSAKQKSPAKMVENIILTGFTDHLQKPTTSTEQFFTGLSQTIASSLKDVGAHDETEMRNRLRNLVIKFVDLLLSKVTWYPQHPESIWASVTQAAGNISQLCSSHIINHLDDADELYKTLVSRFIWFVGEFGSQLPVSWYETIEADLTGGLVPFLETRELDEGIMSKKTLVLDALAHGKTCAIAAQTHGLMID